MKRLAVHTLAFAALLGACGKKSASSDSANSATAAATPTPTPAAATPVAPPEKAASLMGTAVQNTAAAASSLSAKNSSAQAALAFGLNEAMDLSGDTTACNGGTPINPSDTVFASTEASDLGEVNERAPYYGAARWYCVMSNDSGDTGTLPGAFSFSAGMSCAIGPLKYDGSETNLAKTITIDATCFSAKTVAQFASMGLTSMPVSVTAGPAPSGIAKFDKLLQVTIAKATFGTNAAADVVVKTLFSNTADHVAFSQWQTDPSGFGGTAVAANLDITNGAIRYEMIEDGWNPNALVTNSRVRHIRMVAHASITAAGAVTGVSDLEGAIAETYYHAAGGSVPNPNYSTVFTSMSGNPKAGVKTRTINGGSGGNDLPSLQTMANLEYLDKETWPNGTQASPVVAATERNSCFGDTGATCAGNAGIEPLTAADFAFYLFPKSAVGTSPGEIAYDAFANSDGAFLTFDKVTMTVTQ